MVKRLLPLILLLPLTSCDTFRALDSVNEPEPWDTSTLPRDMAGDSGVGVDVNNMTPDTAGVTDVGRDAATPDMSTDAGADGGMDTGQDMGAPTGCLRNFAFAPPWASGMVSVPKAEIVETGVYPLISLAANDGKFGVVARVDDLAGLPFARFYSFNGDNAASRQTVVIPHAVLEPWRDVAVSAGTGPGEFAYVALGENPTCVGFGQLLTRGTIDVSAQPTISGFQSEDGMCDEYRPRVAVTGPFGTPPHFAVTNTTGTVAVAFPGPLTSPNVNTSTSGRLSASAKDLVSLPAAGGGWHAWFPGRLSEATSVVNLDNDGTLEVEWLYEDCYLAAGPKQQLVRIAALECTGPCNVIEQNDISPGEYVSQVDIARMPGGGYVLVLARGAGVQRLVAYFFDDAGQPVQLNGTDSVELVNVGKVVGDFSIGATQDGDDVVVAVAYTTSVTVSPTVSDDLRVATLKITGVEF